MLDCDDNFNSRSWYSHIPEILICFHIFKCSASGRALKSQRGDGNGGSNDLVGGGGNAGKPSSYNYEKDDGTVDRYRFYLCPRASNSMYLILKQMRFQLPQQAGRQRRRRDRRRGRRGAVGQRVNASDVARDSRRLCDLGSAVVGCVVVNPRAV